MPNDPLPSVKRGWTARAQSAFVRWSGQAFVNWISSFVVAQPERHFQDRRPQQLSLGVDPQRAASPAGQSVVKNEIQRHDLGQLEPLHARYSQLPEMLLPPDRRQAA